MKTNKVIFITGAFITNNVWKEWQAYFEQNDFDTLVPSWPYKDAPAEVLRNRHPETSIASVRLQQLVDHYASIIKTLPEKPILIGHSMGGLIAQLLLQRNLGKAAVAIHSVPPQGVITFKLSFFRSTFKPLGFFTSAKKPHLMSFAEWQYAITNGMPLDEQKKSYYEFASPESKMVLRDTLTSDAKIDFSEPHAPLLFIAGSTDHIMPASLNYSNFKKYSHKKSVTEFKEFSGRNHFVLGLPTWKEEANYILDWLKKLS
ncbi:MAG: alpha/beta hydrolase [Cyclobacteriaceae bacterium]|nr:alpha/beta hydrolase [Cyclobacteriaceae bacterium]